MSLNRTSIPERNLDVLRSVAVLCVLADHLGLALHPLAVPRMVFTQIGHAGVLLFFVHTSLVLMASLERQGQHPGWVRHFYVRRAFRIYPLAMATLLIALAVHVPSGTPSRGEHQIFREASAVATAANLLLVENVVGVRNLLAPYWSLPLEVDMYLLLPLCYLVARRRSARDMALLLAGLVAAHLIVSHSGIPGAWRLTVFDYGPSFFGGVLAYHLLRRRPVPVVSAAVLPALLLAAVALVPLLGTTSATVERAWIPCLLLGAALPWIAELRASVVTRAAKTIARYSYGIYLLHIPVLWLAFDVGGSLPLALQLSMVVAGLIVLPWLAYHGIEQPGIRLGQMVVHGRPTLASTQPAP